LSTASPRQSSRRLLSLFVHFVARLLGRESAWEPVRISVPTIAFGPGSQRPFAEYFNGDSSVRVHSIDDIVVWLQGCEYVSDIELFHQRDFWQHPSAFERTRRGDCEDFALWAWRKLAEIGVDADFCVGRVICVDDSPGRDRQHAWVVFRVDETAFVFEPAAQIRSKMIRPFADVMEQYVPHFAVNHRFETQAFIGCASDSHRDRARTNDSV
jgi:hypothetical protein